MIDPPPTGMTHLQAGRLSCSLDGADIRDIAVGDRRILTRLYLAVRDESWNTIPFACTVREISTGPDRFDVELSCSVDAPPIHAEWTAMITAPSADEFSYTIAGRMLSSFRYAKLGLNLHHPLPESLGSRYVARGHGESSTGIIPSLIDPQLFVDGKLTAMFSSYDELTLKGASDDAVVFSFAGDEFEMQDHRNWTDYNLKSYGTPLAVPLPLIAQVDQPILQSVSIDLHNAHARASGRSAASRSAGDVVSVDRSGLAVLPRIGSQLTGGSRLSEAVMHLVTGIGLDYVRLDVELTSEEGRAAGAGRISEIATWGLPVELAVVVSPGEIRHEEIERLAGLLESCPLELERVVVLEAPRGYFLGRTATAGAKVRVLREVVEERCGPVALVSATEQFFADLNRHWPDLAGVDGVGYTICPQVHAADDISLMENSRGQADTVWTTRARSGQRPVHVISVVMIGQYGPYPGGVPNVPDRSAYGDPRQHAGFCAAWTVSSLDQLAGAGTASATYFELIGDRGLIRKASSPSGSEAGTGCLAGPSFRVIETALSWKEGNLVRVVPSEGGGVVGLGMEWPDRTELLLANLTPVRRKVVLSDVSGRLAHLSELDSGDSARQASWAAHLDTAPSLGARGEEELEIAGFGVVRVRSVIES